MKKNVILIVLLLFATNSFSQVDTTNVAFVSYWSVGDSYDFKVSKIKKQWKKGILSKDRTQSYIANFTVIDSTASSYTIKWSYETNLGSTYNIPEKLLNKFSKYKLREVIYKTSEVGDFLEVLNWKEIGEITNSIFDEIIKLAGESDKDLKKKLITAMEPFKKIYSSKQGIEQLVLKELQYFHFPMGLEYNITEPILYEDEVPNMLGGKPIKAKGKVYFEDVDFDEGFCVMKQELKLNPDDTKEILKQVFKKMKLGGRKIKKGLKNAVFEINDHNTYEYYYYPGVPRKIETTRETIIDIDNKKAKGIEKTIIELIYNE